MFQVNAVAILPNPYGNCIQLQIYMVYDIQYSGNLAFINDYGLQTNHVYI